MASQAIPRAPEAANSRGRDRVVELVRGHIRTDHPDLLDMATPQMIRTWIEIIP